MREERQEEGKMGEGGKRERGRGRREERGG